MKKKVISLEKENAKGTNTYTVYKVFDVTSSGEAVAYKLVGEDKLSDAMKAAGFSEANGYVTLANADEELTTAQIDAIKAYVTAGPTFKIATPSSTISFNFSLN